MSCLGDEELELSCMADARMALGMSNDDTHTAYFVNIGRYTMGTAAWLLGNDGATSCVMKYQPRIGQPAMTSNGHVLIACCWLCCKS